MFGLGGGDGPIGGGGGHRAAWHQVGAGTGARPAGGPSNLQAELSTFVGRADDLERGARLLGKSRLVTFTGAGGCGKTRLARQVAARVADRFPGGLWWVELASLADGALVAERVARTLGLQHGETAAVADYFTDRTALLLLDNCERIAGRVPPSSSPGSCGAQD